MQKIKILKYQKEFSKMGKDIQYYDGVIDWFESIDKYVKNLLKEK